MKWSLNDVWLYTFWAFVAGATIPIGTANNAILNTRSEFPQYQAFYTSLLGIALGGFGLLPLAYVSAIECKAPTRWWSLCGGLWTLPAFGILIAAPDLGIQLTLLVGLVAQLATTLLLDRLDGRHLFTSPSRLLAVGIVLCGVFMDQPNPPISKIHLRTRSLLASNQAHDGLEASLTSRVVIVDIVLSALSGIGYTLQSKCNNVLSKDVGSAAGATAVSAAVNALASVPICWYLCACLEKWPTFLLQDWPRFVFAAFQSAFYIGSLSLVPRFIGYTTSFMAVHCGSLVTSTMFDAAGTLGKRIPFGISRAIALMFVLAGVWLFSRATAAEASCETHEKPNGDDATETQDRERQALTSGERLSSQY